MVASVAEAGGVEIDLDALKVERDENDQRKEPTTSEKVALAEAIAERMNDRKGSNQYVKKEGPEIFPDAHGDTRDIAAAKAGLGSGKTLEAAQKVIERDIPELVEAMETRSSVAPRIPPDSPALPH